MTENLTILKKGLILVTVPFLFQVAFLGLVLKAFHDVSMAQTWALHTKEVIARAETPFRKLVEAQNGVNGFVLSGNPVYSRMITEAQHDVHRDLARLYTLVADRPAQQEKAAQIARRANVLQAWQLEMRRRVDAADSAGALAEIRDLKGKVLLDELRGVVDEFLRVEEQLDRERMARLTRSTRQQAWALLGGGAAAVVGLTVLASVLSRGITRRFMLLTENARRLAEGRELAAPLAGRDEIARLDRVFHEMARALEEKNRENELFIYSVSHDLRSPLVNLQGFSQELGHASKELLGIFEDTSLPEQLKGRVLRLLDDDIRSSIQFIQTAVSRLSAIIDALLRLSRAGQVEYRWQAVDVEKTVNRVVEALGTTISERGAQVLRGELPPAWGDPTAIDQIFANLISNALNYLDPKRPGLIEVGVDGEHSSGPVRLLCYYVKDNGLGIPESGKSKLFLAFQRFHPGAANGEGIGLALVRRIVERHGGRIRVESAVGAGSTFFVELPAVPAEGNVPEPAKPTFEQRGGFA